MMIRNTAVAFTLVSLFAFGGLAGAQSAGDSNTGDSDTTYQTAKLSMGDPALNTFVDAFVAVQKIHLHLATHLDQATDTAEVQAMRQQAQKDMARAVESHGMTIQEYNATVVVLQLDPELMQRIEERARRRL
jgi:hypothetical protein